MHGTQENLCAKRQFASCPHICCRLKPQQFGFYFHLATIHNAYSFARSLHSHTCFEPIYGFGEPRSRVRAHLHFIWLQLKDVYMTFRHPYAIAVLPTQTYDDGLTNENAGLDRLR